MSSEISGKVKPEFQNKIGSLMKTLLPAGSILGAQNQNFKNYLRNPETYERGFYTGVCSYFDGENLDSYCDDSVYSTKRRKFNIPKWRFGITHLSKLADEYQEMKNKIMSRFIESIKIEDQKPFARLPSKTSEQTLHILAKKVL